MSSDASTLTVSNFKWSRARRNVETPPVEGNAPARAMIPQNRNFARNARINDPQGVRDPNADTLDGRSAAMEKSVAESRAPKAQPLDGYAYRIKVQNPATKVVEIVFWEYQFHDPANPELVARRQFLCGVNIPAGKGKDLEGFSLSGPSEVVNVKTLNAGSSFQGKRFDQPGGVFRRFNLAKKSLESCGGEGKLRARAARAVAAGNVQGTLGNGSGSDSEAKSSHHRR